MYGYFKHRTTGEFLVQHARCQVGIGTTTCSSSRLSLDTGGVASTVTVSSAHCCAPAVFSSRVALIRGEMLELLASDSMEPCDCSSSSRLSSLSRSMLLSVTGMEGEAALLWFVRLDVCEEEGEVIGALHMGQFCLIFNQGSTHFLWNSCLTDKTHETKQHETKQHVTKLVMQELLQRPPNYSSLHQLSYFESKLDIKGISCNPSLTFQVDQR